MNEFMYIVIVDTRGMPPAQIDGYEERTCAQEFFDEHILSIPSVRCVKSKVAELCGMDMKIYFHEFTAENKHHHALGDPPEIAISNEEKDDLYPSNVVNGGATLLTFDPRTGFPEYRILGKAYIVVDSGDYPLSNHQVWGLQELISEARDFYYCDPDHQERGRRNLLKWCLEYREKEYGPLTIYEPRTEARYPEDEASYYRHRHFDHEGETVVASHRQHHHPDAISDGVNSSFGGTHRLLETPGRKQITDRLKKGRSFPRFFMFGRDDNHIAE
jgi:hypothetical protein